MRVLPARFRSASVALSVLVSLVAGMASAAPWFQSPYLTFNVGTRPTVLAAGDLDEDGATDLIVDGAVLLSNGDGTFKHRVPLPRIAFTTLGDMNGDGHLDAVVSGSQLSVFPGLGNGTFGPPTNTAGSYQRIAIADMNNDGKKDVVILGTTWRPGNGDGTFGPAYPTSPPPYSLEDDMAIGDANHDGWLDVVAPHGRGLAEHPCWSLWPGTGAALAAAQPQGTCGIGHYFHIATGDLDGDGFAEVRPDGMEIADLNGDGRNDVIDWSYERTLSTRLGLGGGALGGASVWPVGSTYVDATVGDFNEDGDPDIAVATWDCDVLTQGMQCDFDIYPTTITVLLGNGDGTFGSGSVVVPRTGVRWVAMGDVDGDGRTDLVTAQSSNTISVLTGNGDTTFDPPVNYGVTNATRVEILDVDRDGRPDLVANGTSVAIYRGLGGGTFGDLHTVPGSGWTTFADFNGDTRLDLAISNDTGLAIHMGNGDGSFGPPVQYPMPVNSDRTDAGDLDGDGDIDLVSTAYFDGIRKLLNNGNGTFGASSVVYNTFDRMSRIVVADVSGDGRADILAAPRAGLGGSLDFSTVLFFRGTGSAMFAPVQKLDVGAQPTDLRVVDFDQDGKLDVVTSDDRSNSASVLKGNGDGTFREKTGYGGGSMPDNVALGDVNGDGLPDLAMSSNLAGNVTIFLHPPDDPTPARLALFEAKAIGRAIEIRWRFTEGGPSDVTVERASAAAGPWRMIDGAPRRDGSTLTIVDGSAESGVLYWYRLAARGADGSTTTFAPVTARLGTDAAIALSVAPNPGAGLTRVRYTLPRDGAVRVTVLDLQGRVVAVLADGRREAGEHVVDWQGRTAGGVASPGVYVIRLEQAAQRVERRLAWIR